MKTDNSSQPRFVEMRSDDASNSVKSRGGYERHSFDYSTQDSLTLLDAKKKEPGGVTGKDMDRVFQNAADGDQITREEYMDLREWVSKNWDSLTQEAKDKWNKFDKAMQAAGGPPTWDDRHKVLAKGDDVKNLVADLKGEPRVTAKQAEAVLQAAQKDGLDSIDPQMARDMGKAIEHYQAERVLKAASKMVDAPVLTAAEMREVAQIVERAKPKPKTELRSDEGSNSVSSRGGIENHSYDRTTQDSLNLLNEKKGRKGAVTGEDMDRVFQNAADLGQITREEYMDLREWMAQNWESLSPEAQEKWHAFDKAMQDRSGTPSWNDGPGFKPGNDRHAVIASGKDLASLLETIKGPSLEERLEELRPTHRRA